MKFEQIVLNNPECFNLKDIFECGQCFRWHKEIDGSYTGVVKIGILNVSKQSTNTQNDIMVKGYIKDDDSLLDFCNDYFDLSKSYTEIQKEISKDDDTMKQSIAYGNGIRILNQDPWEMLISYIISAANNIPRISKCIENISMEFGEKIVVPDEIMPKIFSFYSESENSSKIFYLFPKPHELNKATLESLRKCNLGFRDKYVLNASQLVTNNQLDLNNIEQMEYKEAKKALVKINGVGDKVADCILLFSMKKSMAFPVDTWIKKIMNEVYIDSVNVKKINEYAIKKWGNNAGIAQQYLFYYKRNG